MEDVRRMRNKPPGEYVEYRLRFADTAFENREDPRMHRFRTPPPSHERVVVHGRADRVRDAIDTQVEGSSDDTIRRRR